MRRAGGRSMAAIIVGCTLLASGATQAADFVFDVPVDLDRMHPDVSFGQIVCSVRNEHNASIGSGSARFNIDGSVSRTVRVAFDADAYRDPNEADHYTCNLILSVDGYTQPVTVFANESARTYDPRGAPAPGTPFVSTVNGRIAR